MIEYFNKKLKKNPSERIGIVFGASKDKKVDEELAMLEEFADLIYLVKAYNHPRAMPIEQLTAGIGETKYPYKFSTFFITQGLVGNGEISKAMLYILAQKKLDCVIVCGSFFIMPEAKEFLKLGKKTDKQRDFTEGYELVNPS